ncbi:MAG: hypothetical protein WBB70_01575 [Desulfobacterales bacterium]
MDEIYLIADISFDGQIIQFTSDRPYFPKGCLRCGLYKEMPYGNQAVYLDYFNGRFLCDGCYVQTIPGEPISKIARFRTISADLRDKYILRTIDPLGHFDK